VVVARRSGRLRLARVAAALALTMLAGGLVEAADAAPGDPGPRLQTPVGLLDDAISCPARLTRKVVLLVHGTSVTADENWSWNYVKALPHEGFDVCTVQMPDRLLIDIQTTTEYVVHAIRVIARRSGRPIDVVGLSQGALQPRWALRWWPDLRNLVDDYVSMAGTNRGSVFADASCVSDCIPSLWQQRTSGSLFLGALDRGDETPGRVSYTSVYSLTDEIIQPSAPDPVAAIRGASNIAVQDVCPGRYVGHVQSASDAAYYAVVLDALTHLGPADPSRVDRDFCTQTVMPYVDPRDAVVRTAEVYVFAGVVQAEHEKVAAEPPLRPYARGKA
jgi:triacylglycerol esterase/lipase EstA (alpha/beta hydrolase family)